MGRNRETVVERKVCEHAKSIGMRAHKLQGVGNDNMPDRIFTYRGYALYVEFKQAGGKVRPGQLIVAKHLAEEHHPTALVDNADEGKALLNDFKEAVDEQMGSLLP